MPETYADLIVVVCAECNARMRVPASKAGKRGHCPKCSAEITIGDRATSAPISSSGAGSGTAHHESSAAAASMRNADGDVALTADGRLKFHCKDCGKSLKTPTEAIGRRVKCPGCQAVVTVPLLAGASPGDHDSEGVSDDLLEGLGCGQAVEPMRPIRSAIVASAGPQTSSLAGAAAGAKAALGAAGAVGGLVANPVLMGALCSAIGAAIGGAIWCGVAYKTHYEVGWIAWIVGALAGAGMRLGYRDVGDFAGMVAGAFALLGIIAGKFAVFYLILAPLFASISEVTEFSREDLSDMVARRVVIDSGKHGEDEDDKFEAAVAAELPRAEAEVAKLTDDQVNARGAQLAGQLQDEMHSEMRNSFWAVMFGFWDIVFLPLAIITAYRIASGWSTGD